MGGYGYIGRIRFFANRKIQSSISPTLFPRLSCWAVLYCLYSFFAQFAYTNNDVKCVNAILGSKINELDSTEYSQCLLLTLLVYICGGAAVTSVGTEDRSQFPYLNVVLVN